MSFHPDSIEVSGETRNGVRFKLVGSESWQSGEYTNDRNTTKKIAVSKERAKSIRDDLDEILGDIE